MTETETETKTEIETERLRGREGKRGRENKKFVAGGLEKSGECPEHKADCKQPKI